MAGWLVGWLGGYLVCQTCKMVLLLGIVIQFVDIFELVPDIDVSSLTVAHTQQWLYGLANQAQQQPWWPVCRGGGVCGVGCA